MCPGTLALVCPSEADVADSVPTVPVVAWLRSAGLPPLSQSSCGRLVASPVVLSRRGCL